MFQLSEFPKLFLFHQTKDTHENFQFQISICFSSQNHRTMSDIAVTYRCMRVCNTSGASLFTSYTPWRTAYVSMSSQVVFMDVNICCIFESVQSRAAHLPDNWTRTDLNLLWFSGQWRQPPKTINNLYIY